MSKSASHALSFKRLCRAAAKELGVEPTAEIAVTLATYRLARSALQARLISGGNIDANELLKVDEAIKAIKPPVMPRVTVEIVGPALTQCPKCDHQFDPKSPHATQAKKPRVIDGEVAAYRHKFATDV